MATLAEIRQKYPQYSDMSDGALADALHKKFYSDMPRGDFDAKVGIQPATFSDRFAGDGGAGAPKPPQESTFSDVMKSAGSGLASGVAGLIGLPNTLSNLVDSGVRGAHHLITGNELPKPQGPAGALFPGADTVVGGIEGVTGKLHEPTTTAGKYARTVGEFAPGALMGGGGLLGRIGGNVLAPAIGSETAGQLAEGTKGEGAARLAGAMAGALTPSGLSRFATPLPANAARQASVDTLRREGVDMTAGQTTGRKGLQYFESEMGGGKAADLMTRQGEQFTSAALKRAGVSANRATPEVVDDAFKQVGQRFDNLASQYNVPPDPMLTSTAKAAENAYNSVVSPSNRAPIVSKIADDIANSPGLTGAQYKDLRSRVSEMTRSSSDPEIKKAMGKIQTALDDAMERSIANSNPSDVGAWKEVRGQYRNLIAVEKAATGAGENAAQGIISPSALRNAVVGQGRRAYARGQGDFAELARAGEAVLKPLPQSGTAPRLRAQGLLQGIGAAGGASAGGQQGGFEGALLGALAGAAVPFSVGRIGLSRPIQAYLKNQKFSKPRALLEQLERQGILGSRYLEDDR